MTAKRRPLFVGGAGGFGRETAEMIVSSAALGAELELAGFLDDEDSLRGSRVGQLEVVGGLDSIHQFPQHSLVLTMGNPKRFDARATVVERLGLPPDRYLTLIHPSAHIGSSVRIGEGTVVQAQCVFTADIRIGSHVVIMPHVVLTHDDRIEDYATIAAGVLLAGGVHIGEGAYIGSGVRIKEGIEIGEGAIVGMGSVVTKNVPPHQAWYGNPARQMSVQ